MAELSRLRICTITYGFRARQMVTSPDQRKEALMASSIFILHLDCEFDPAVGAIIGGVHFVDHIDFLDVAQSTLTHLIDGPARILARFQNLCVMHLVDGLREKDIDAALATVSALSFVQGIYDAHNPPPLEVTAWLLPVDKCPKLEIQLNDPVVVSAITGKIKLVDGPPGTRIFVNGICVEDGHEIKPNDHIVVMPGSEVEPDSSEPDEELVDAAQQMAQADIDLSREN